MKLTFDEKKLLYAYGNPNLALTRKRLYEVAGLTVAPRSEPAGVRLCPQAGGRIAAFGTMVRPDVLLRPFRDGVLCWDTEAGAGH